MKKSRISRIVGPIAVAGLALAVFAPSALGHGGAAGGKYGIVDSFKAGKYRVTVSGSPVGGGIAISKGDLGTGYYTDSKSTPTHIKANLKSFGEIDLKFEAEGEFKKDKKPRGCTGKPGKSQKGTWKGKIKFKGEGGYVKVDENSAKGRVVKPGNLNCPIGPGGSKKYINLGSSNNSGNDSTSFNATVRKSGGKPAFSAFSASQKGGIDINRFANAKGKASDFTYNDSYTHAEVKPGGAFKGKGVFDAITKGGTTQFGEFSGLKVSYLGKKNVSLNSNQASLGESQFRQR